MLVALENSNEQESETYVPYRNGAEEVWELCITIATTG
jgi:hypothetical protein